MGRSTDIAGRVHRAYAWAEDRQIHYRRSGPDGARSPLLLLHAPESSSAPFEGFMAEMGRDRSVIAPDLPGCGMSDPIAGQADAQAQASVLLQVVAELGLGMVDVVGVKDGGDLAVEMARQQPEVVRKIILVSASAPKGLGQPTLALDLPAFPGASDHAAASAVKDFLDR